MGTSKKSVQMEQNGTNGTLKFKKSCDLLKL